MFHFSCKIQLSWFELFFHFQVLFLIHFFTIYLFLFFLKYYSENVTGDVERINFSQPQRGSQFCVSVEQANAWYKSLNWFVNFTYHPRNVVKLKMEEGCIIFYVCCILLITVCFMDLMIFVLDSREYINFCKCSCSTWAIIIYNE